MAPDKSNKSNKKEYAGTLCPRLWLGAVRSGGLYVECCHASSNESTVFSSGFPMLSRDRRRTRNTGSIRLPDRFRHLPTYEVRLAINRAITAGTSLRQFGQLHSYSTSLRCVVWPHLLHMCLPSTCATMRRNSKPETQYGHRTAHSISAPSFELGS